MSTDHEHPTPSSGTGNGPQPVGVTGPRGFRASGVAAGIKEGGGPDLALVVNDGPRREATGLFTTNKVKAAPVLWSEQVLRERRLHAVVLNSGGANACTGPEGFQDTHSTAERVAGELGTGAIEVAVCSTGLIGQRLPMEALLSGVTTAVGELSDSGRAAEDAATAILTTDSGPKQAFVRHPSGFSVGAMVKGAGMIAPNLATMLAVLTTDAVAEPDVLDQALRRAAATTFERLDVDGGTSTNDTVLLLSSGASGVAVDTDELTGILTETCAELVRHLQYDAEGATKAVDVTVRGAVRETDAVRIARVVAEDNLVGTALFGSDPNWGRIAMAVGRALADTDAEAMEIALNGVTLYSAGVPVAEREVVDLSGREVEIVIDLRSGPHEATVYTTDLSHGYVEENSAYSS
nr:bifunctional glutamate N-acetyltransferase/amino-acid acetyltransferase ArgJ [Actinopolyspora mortivallis]